MALDIPPMIRASGIELRDRDHILIDHQPQLLI
jgi:hypothetical protein